MDSAILIANSSVPFAEISRTKWIMDRVALASRLTSCASGTPATCLAASSRSFSCSRYSPRNDATQESENSQVTVKVRRRAYVDVAQRGFHRVG